MTPQQKRVLAASRTFDGTCAADFAAPNVCDGGKPIMRVPARIGELETLGYTFEIVGWRGSTKCYRLADVESGVQPPPVVGPPGRREPSRLSAGLSTDESLFGVPRVQGQPHWRDGEAA